ncbi:MAG TPA: sialidase family protein [Armatimonadota bacterium]|jgi:sialidase-1
MRLENTTLFQGMTDGYEYYRIPGLLVTTRGVVLATCEARHGGDWGENDLLIRRSTDGGVSWEPPRLLAAHAGYGDGPVSNLVLIADQADGAVHALYCYDYGHVYYLRSDDDGVSFSAPVAISLEAFRQAYPWQVVATGPGHGTQLRNGRLVVPLWLSEGSSAEFPGKRGHRPSAVSSIYSDDHGRSWQCGEIVCRHGLGGISNPSETVMVELMDGCVLFNVRSESAEHRRLVTVSPDGASGWSAPYFDDSLLEPICMAGLIRASWPTATEPGRIIFSNPDNLERQPTNWGTSCDRQRLTIKMSEDDCRTWPLSRVLEAGLAGYSDLAVLPDGTVLCFYERGDLGGPPAETSLTLAHFDMGFLE